MKTANIQSVFGKGSFSKELQKQFIGAEFNYPPNTTGLGSAWIKKAGVLLNRTSYPDLWEWVQKTQGEQILTDENWLAQETLSYNGAVSVYSSGDGSTTFRTPTVGEGGFAKSAGTVTDPVLLNIGFQDQIVNITGSFPPTSNQAWITHNATEVGTGEGALNIDAKGSSGTLASSGGAGANFNFWSFDASRVVNTGSEVQPKGQYVATYIYTGSDTSQYKTAGTLENIISDSVADLMIVENYLKANQNCNVPSGTSDLPNETAQDYLTGDYFAYDFECVTDCIGVTKIGKILNGTSGKYRRKYKGDFSSAYAAVQLADGYTSQDGVSVSYDTATDYTWVDVEFGVAPAHEFVVLAPSAGKVAVINDSDSAKDTHVTVDFGLVSNNSSYLVDNPYGNDNDTNCFSRVQLSETGADGTWFTTGQSSQTSNISGWVGIISDIDDRGIALTTAAGNLTLSTENIGGLTTRPTSSVLTSAYCRVIVYYQGAK